jgi:hypothetical protein
MARDECKPRKPTVHAVLKAAKANGFSRVKMNPNTGEFELFTEAAGASQDADPVGDWIKKHEAK